MNQSIVAIIRPKLNLAQKESQAAHIIEHLLLSPQRVEEMGITDDYYADNIIAHSGQVNDFYMVEYYVVKSEVAAEVSKMLFEHRNDLYASQDQFDNYKAVVIEELNEKIGEFISTGEQMSRAIYNPNSPTIRNPWNDIESIQDLSLEDIEKIFNRCNTELSQISISFDSLAINDKLTIEGNNLISSPTTKELTHPWQPLESIDCSHIVPVASEIDYLVNMIYNRSLDDARFGLLYDEIRFKQGLAYDISISTDFISKYSEIYYSSSPENAEIVGQEVKKLLANYDQHIAKAFKHIIKRLKLDLELQWGDIQNWCLDSIDDVVSGAVKVSNSELIKSLDEIKVDTVIEYNREFLDSLNNRSIKVVRRYADKVASNS